MSKAIKIADVAVVRIVLRAPRRARGCGVEVTPNQGLTPRNGERLVDAVEFLKTHHMSDPLYHALREVIMRCNDDSEE